MMAAMENRPAGNRAASDGTQALAGASTDPNYTTGSGGALDPYVIRAVESALMSRGGKERSGHIYVNSAYPEHSNDRDAHMSYNLETHTFFDHKLDRGGGLYELAGLLGVTISRSGNGASRPEAPYEYANGTRKKRYYDGQGEKHFAWEHLDKGRWEKGRDGRDPGMYHQAEAFGGDPGEWIHVFNGEKAAARAILEGIKRATCFPDGEGKSKLNPAYVPLFKGRKVVWHQDNDATGAEFTAEMLRHIPQIAEEIKVIEWGGFGVPEGGDAYDAFDLDLTAEQLQKIVDATPAVPKPAAPKMTTWADADGLIGDVEWEWPGWLAKGFMTMLTAFSGVGKSAHALRICGTYINGWDWPDGTPYLGEAKAVLWCESEFAQAINIARAKAYGIPLDRFYPPFDDPMLSVELDNESHQLAIYEKAMRPDVGLIVFDSYSGGSSKDENKVEGAKVGFWMAQLARDTGKPVLCLHHLVKRGFLDTDKPVTLEMVRGHSGIVQPARVVWAMDIPDANTPERKRLAVIKSNLGRFPEAIGLTITESGVQFGNAPEPPRQESQLGKACDLLKALLASGPLKQGQLEGEAKGAGISWDTMKRAKDKLGIVAKRDGRENCWKWGLMSW